MGLPARSSPSSRVVLPVLCSFAVFSVENLAAQVSSWPMIGYDASHTSWNSSETALRPPFPVEIVYSVGPAILGLSADGGTIFANCREDTNEVRAVDSRTGDVLWTFLLPETHGASDNTPAVWDTLIFVGGQGPETRLHCLDARTGAEVWSHPTGSLYTRHAVVDEGRVYVNAESLLCLDAVTGALLWGRPSDVSAVPAIKGDTLYASTHPDSLLALDKVTGALLWQVEVPVARGVLVAADSLLYLKSTETELVARRLEDGGAAWSRNFPGEELADVHRGCLAYAHGMLYASVWADSAGNAKIYAQNAGDGTPVWEHTFSGYGAFNPVVANGVVYLQSWSEGTLYAFDAMTGDILTTLAGTGYEYIVSEGSLIAGDVGENLHIWRMEPLGLDGGDRHGPVLPAAPFLAQNFPNPFNPATTIAFDQPVTGPVSLRIFDLRGRLVDSLLEPERREAGHHEIVWGGRDVAGHPVASGIYFCRLQVGGETLTRKMILLE